MALVLATLRNRVMALLNASSTYSVLDDSERWSTNEIDAALIASDGKVYEAIASNKNHPRRKALTAGTASDVVHGSSLASRIGPLESVTFVIDGVSYPGVEKPVSYLERLNRENLNPDHLTSLEPHFILDGDTIWHNKAGLLLGGASAVSVNTAFFTYTASAALQCPDENENDVIDEAMKMLRPKEGAHEAAAGLHGNWAAANQERIRNLPVGPRPVSESPE